MLHLILPLIQIHANMLRDEIVGRFLENSDRNHLSARF